MARYHFFTLAKTFDARLRTVSPVPIGLGSDAAFNVLVNET